MKNYAASVRARLKKVFDKEYESRGITPHHFEIRYFHERLLYRISISDYREKLYLKGGALIYAIEREKSRPTNDIDFLGRGIRSDPEELKVIFSNICKIPCEQDGVIFNLEDIDHETINKHGKYPGLNLRIEALLGKMKKVIWIDIGFGDAVIPEPQELEYPTLLDDLGIPKIKAYHNETIIAEKFEAMINRAEYNSRIKDFYDVYKLLLKRAYDRPTLEEAIAQTFRRRETATPENHPVFGEDFANDIKRISEWQDLLKEWKLEDKPSFQEVMKVIKEHLEVIYIELSASSRDGNQS